MSSSGGRRKIDETVAGAAAQAAQLFAVGDRQHSCFIVGATAAGRCGLLVSLAGEGVEGTVEGAGAVHRPET